MELLKPDMVPGVEQAPGTTDVLLPGAEVAGAVVLGAVVVGRAGVVVGTETPGWHCLNWASKN